MKTIELSAAIASAPVQENLKNFAGLDAQNALGLMTPERLAAVAGELYNSNKKLLGAKDDLNNLSDGWYYYINANNPANAVSNADNSVLLQLSYKGSFRHAKFQLLFSENAKAIFFRLMENSKAWSRWVNLVRA